ncbi:hypothetical protein BST22_20345 [Mycolicibacterium chubuense]|nr:hypothetical protein BST22_20345 [Mycolicibacterium chubuense]
MTAPSMSWYPDQRFGPAAAAVLPQDYAFYRYDAAKLADKPRGTVLKSRRRPHHVAGRRRGPCPLAVRRRGSQA